jgi:hypothetical protein
MDAKQVINRIGKLQEFEVQVTMPKVFSFNGSVPYDIEILGDQAFITILAESIEEATQRARDYVESLEV